MLPINVQPLCRSQLEPPTGYEQDVTLNIARRPDGSELRQRFIQMLNQDYPSLRFKELYCSYHFLGSKVWTPGYAGLLLRGWRE